MSTEHIEQAARSLAEAKVNGARTEAALAAASAGRKRIADRVAALSGERAAIVGKARAGSSDPALSLRLSVIDFDLVDLAELAAGADAEVAKTGATVAEARQAIARAEQQLAMASDVELERRLVEHASKLDMLLLATLNELAAVGKGIGRSRPLFAPSPALADVLWRLHLTASAIRR